jgi:tryptophanyl-tRNA synthetase
MEGTTSFGQLRRMTQFKDKSESSDFVSASLFTYPALMAADILLYDTEEVPVGDDQRQHVELTRDVAERFNNRYGPTFTVPKAVIQRSGARVMDLQDPTRKMSKSDGSSSGTILVLEDVASIAKKIKRAVTDTEYDPKRPGAANLLSILGASTGRSPDDLSENYSQYGPLKSDVTDAVIAVLEPIQRRYRELSADPTTVAKILEAGAEKAQTVAAATLDRARRNIGLLVRGEG